MAIIIKVSGMTKKTGGSATVDASRACSNGRSEENECNNGVPHLKDSIGIA